MAITPQVWQNITFEEVEKIFFALPFATQEQIDYSGIGIYGFFEIKAGRERLRYIGKSTSLGVRLRGPWYHEHWLPSDAVRILEFPLWKSHIFKGCETFMDHWRKLERFLDTVEIRLIMRYNPARNTHWRTSRPPHKYCTIGRPLEQVPQLPWHPATAGP